ncbi:girdin-like isoform X2 [Gigantopelta aegis]|uniref:girdin-like isoform X2 n=1 Tax=Gigantopelta aegis TaxID=1735272 RepID=UPI001B8892C5|nr:girdin-like isoform X2 [Gigantopelta aegis]
MATHASFMENPLVVWVNTFHVGDVKPLTYKDLYDGVFLNDVMQQIDPVRPAYQAVNRVVDDDVTVRLFNWDLLVKNIKTYYLEVLQQLLIAKLPNIHIIANDPNKDTSFEEIRTVLLLILGCAVQCERKQEFIENIKQLEIDVQHAIVDHIREVTESGDYIIPNEAPNQPEEYTKTFSLLSQLVQERNDLTELVIELTQERDFYQSQAEGAAAPIIPSISPEKHRLAVELAEHKAKLRRVRQELEEKIEHLSDTQDELDDVKNQLVKLKNENQQLLQDSRVTRSLKDEIDILKEKASKVDTYEKEIIKYKEKLNELEFYKARMEELREENGILEETKAILEDQLDSSHKRVETVIELENELRHFREEIELLTSERDDAREKIQLLVDENLRLEFDKKSSMNESASLEQELGAARLNSLGLGGSLSDQLNETSNARLLRLQLENQQLQQKLKESAENAMIHNTAVNLELEKENQRLSKKVEKLQETNSTTSQKCLELEQNVQELMKEKEKIVQTLEMVKENSDRQVRELERENEHLAQNIEVIRERNEKSNDARTKDLEKENKQLHETISVKNNILSKMEFESKQLNRSYIKLKESASRLAELETENADLLKKSSEMQQKIATLELTCDKFETLEQEFSDIEVENKKLSKTVETVQNSLRMKEKIEEQNINLNVENQKLQRTLESLKSSSGKVIELENDNDVLNREIQQLQKTLETQKSQKTKMEQMEFDLVDLDNDNQRLQKALSITQKRVEALEKDNNDLDSENEKLQNSVETMKSSLKRLEEKNKEAIELETELFSVQKEKSLFEKENRKLKQTLELKDLSLDEMNGKFSALEQEYKGLKKSVVRMKDTCARVKELEKDNKELLQEVNMDKKTLATLREDLVNEKIRSQQLSNELEKLTYELERIGINREKLVHAEQTEDGNKYKALESLMHDTLTKNMEIKEEKIQALESRLEESKNRNQKLNDELRKLKKETESLKQRYEEEMVSRDQERLSPTIHQVRMAPVQQANSTKDILDLKDHLVHLERTNATLLSENTNLRSQVSSLGEQIQKLENQNFSMNSQNSGLHEQCLHMQTNNAKLQVENTAVKSQCESLMTQKRALQTQLTTLESEHEHLIHSHEDLQSFHESLVSDHESLQQLHEQLTSEYESLISEHGSLKSIHKSVKNELRDLQEQLDSLLQGKNDVNKIRDLLEKEREQLKSEVRALGNLQMDYDKLRDEQDRLRAAYNKLNHDYHSLLADHKRVKSENNNLQLKNTELTAELNENKETITCMDVEIQKLENRFDAMYQVNQRLDEENRALLMQVQQLLNQNQDLLMQALENKDQYVEEQKSYIERLADLKRQKERLEEKIMDHYKNRWESPKKRQGFGARLVRKARGIISRTQRSKSRPNLSEDSPENSSLGSGSHGDSTEKVNSKSERKAFRRSSAEISAGSPHLSKQNKSLAKSTTALASLNSSGGLSRLRGAKSNDDLLNDTTFHNASTGEKDSISSGGSLHLHSGLGKPGSLEDDQDAGFSLLSVKSKSSGHLSGRESPGSELITLEQFLCEANKTPAKDKAAVRSPDNAESHSTASTHSDYNSRVILHRPTPITASQDKTHRYTSPLTDIAASGDLNLSNMSRLSGISSSSNTTDTPPHSRLDMKTSTPKVKPAVSGSRMYGQPERPKSVNVELARFQGGHQNMSQQQDDQHSNSRVYGSYSMPKRSNDNPSTITASNYSQSSTTAMPYAQSPVTSSQYPDDRLSSGSSHKSEEQLFPRSSYTSNSYSRPDNHKTQPSTSVPSSQMNVYMGEPSSEAITVPPHSQAQNYIGQRPLDHFVGMSNQSQLSQYSSGPEPLRSPPPPPASAVAGSRPTTRELPPTPPERDVCLSPTERLDKMMNALQTSSNYGSGTSYPNLNNSAERPSREVRPQRNPASQPPVSSSALYSKVIGRPPTSGSSVIGNRVAGDRPLAHSRQTASQALFPQGRPAGANALIKRPSSALGQASNHLQKNDASVYFTPNHSQHGDDRRSGVSSGNSGMKPQTLITHTVTFHNNNLSQSQGSSKQIERPKSVPPHLFNPAIHSSGDDHTNSRGVIPPVPPPRRSRDPVPVGGNISLLQEPAVNSRPLNNMPGPQQPNSSSQASPQSAVDRLLPNHSSRPQPSQTPTARIQPQTKPMNSRPPLSRPVKTEEQPAATSTSQQQQGPKQNAVWPRR